jgi:hypothetical protein
MAGLLEPIASGDVDLGMILRTVPGVAPWVWPLPMLGDRAPVVARASVDADDVAHPGAVLLYRQPEAGDLGPRYGVPGGVPVLAAGAGVVRFAGPTPRGLSVIIDHPSGAATHYAPLASVDLARGASVTAGQPIGTAGHDPHDPDRARHLRFSVWRHGTRSSAIDPSPLLATWPRVRITRARNVKDTSREISISLDDTGRLHVKNVADPLWLEVALRRFFISRGRTERPAVKSRQRKPYVEITIGEARQIIEIWDKYAASAKPLADYRDPRGPWREFAARAAQLMSGKGPDELYPVADVEDLWIAQRRLGLDYSVLKDNQPLSGWSGFATAAWRVTSGWVSGAGSAASDAASAAVSAASDAVGAVGRGLRGLLTPILIGAGVVGGVVVVSMVARR